MGKNNAKLPDIETMLQAGIDPKTGLPINLIRDGEADKNDFRRLFRIIDEQDAVNRYKWYNLPMDITSQQLERMLYFKGQLCFFYFEELEKFCILPFALDGTIDLYGRFNTVHPIPFAGGSTETEKKLEKNQAQLLSTKKLRVIKEPKDLEDLSLEDLKESCVILYDYIPQLNVNNIIPRQALNDILLDTEAEIVSYLQTALLAGTGIKGMRVNDATAAGEANKASKQIRYSALSKKLYVAMTSSIDFQELANGTPLKAEEFLLSLQSIDNLRKATLGIDNGGLFQKKAHELESEHKGNASSVQTTYQDGLTLRQSFALIANSIWGTSMWCMPAEAVLGYDDNMDGAAYDIDQSQTGEIPEDSQGGDENA